MGTKIDPRPFQTKDDNYVTEWYKFYLPNVMFELSVIFFFMDGENVTKIPSITFKYFFFYKQNLIRNNVHFG